MQRRVADPVAPLDRGAHLQEPLDQGVAATLGGIEEEFLDPPLIETAAPQLVVLLDCAADKRRRRLSLRRRAQDENQDAEKTHAQLVHHCRALPDPFFEYYAARRALSSPTSPVLTRDNRRLQPVSPRPIPEAGATPERRALVGVGRESPYRIEGSRNYATVISP
jgi:hypothetical protein